FCCSAFSAPSAVELLLNRRGRRGTQRRIRIETRNGFSRIQSMKVRSWIMATLIAVAITFSAIVNAGADEPKSARYYRQHAALAYKATDWALAAENFNKALKLIPDHPTLFYNLGAISALQGKKADAIAYLSRLTEMGLALHPERDRDFDSIKESAEFKDILKRFESNKAPVINSATAFTVHEKGLITEGLAYDP